MPPDLLPRDGRFGCGPSKVRPEQIEAIVARASSVMGTSHRQAPVKDIVGSVRDGLVSLFGLPDGWEIVLGNGGSTVFWDAATFGLIRTRSQHLVFGEFGGKFAEASNAAPHLEDAVVVSSEPGTHPELVADPSCDVYAFPHNETSTGVMMTPKRPAGDGLVVVDATSAAGGLTWKPGEVDVYYFAPQKCFASDGGLWFAACSPKAIERIREIKASKRWMPASLDLSIALDNSVANQTYNTPALATLIMFDDQLKWMNSNGGLPFAAGRSAESARTLYSWADSRDYATPFVKDLAQRSNVVGTIDIDGVDANDICKVLRANGIVDTDSYRKLGRNQLRIGMFPAIDPADVAQLTRCIDSVVEHLKA
ncbi:MAG: phosphoserine transaminase [Actinobacteria bacterium]|nr:phosphoserine transaminase [Actinomycetota bacterium]